MQHFPVFMAVAGRRIVVAGGGEAACAKLRLLLRTEAQIHVFATKPALEIRRWAEAGRLVLHRRALEAPDLSGAVLAYGAEEDRAADGQLAEWARAAGVPHNIVDDLDRSAFLTPALVDRDPVVVAIGTEGAAPVLARRIKADLEERLPTSLGMLARAAAGFRRAAEALPAGAARRAFWSAFFETAGPEAARNGGAGEVADALRRLLGRHLARAPRTGFVEFVGAGPGDPDLLTLRARRALDRADVVVHDRLVTAGVLDLARREALLIDVGKEGFGPSTPQEAIHALLVEHARAGRHVVRLKGGDPSVFGRLEEEIAAVESAGLAWSVVPGITAASAAAAAIGQPLTARGRNAGLRLLTGHDAAGLAEHDWRALARPGEVAAIYMGRRAARRMQGRLLMHGADPSTPVSVVENAGRAGQRVLATTLARLEPDLSDAGMSGPVLILYGLAPRLAGAALPGLEEVAS
ncbi:siroheme synthase CysG [Rubellimicrobium sp. CFH 75288]|uniref:siroheme synthase CysG n=1 Tax=Rubellimicrobium sp. CFH 75288 TaxID=2697034 RepID=UPI0014121506|nr:siroheme synthase CysG [Rubellimicrobium sp. CFH 75288]NAZ36377.1 uroporphyrinogen-III C-methyltransferase [Rubellimicrobium sp. CFH 75288]